MPESASRGGGVCFRGGVCSGGVWSGGLLPGGVWSKGGCLAWGGLPSGGSVPGGAGIPACTKADTHTPPLWTESQTPVKHYLGPTSLRPVIIRCPVAVPMCVHMKVLALTDRDLKLHMMNESAKDERFFLSDMCNFSGTQLDRKHARPML